MKIIIIGDVHGNFDAANTSVLAALTEHPTATVVVQLGDLGDGWPTPQGPSRWKPSFNLPILVVDGNHENFDALAKGDINPKLEWVQRGDTKTFNGRRAMFFGGATSPDLKDRTIGINWWPQESITRAQVEYALAWDGGPIHTMFCHERADVFRIPPKWKLPIFEGSPGASDRAALSLIVQKHQPDWYFHGHWHHGEIAKFQINRWGGNVDKMPRYPSAFVNVVACPNIDPNNITWTVFDGTQIWRNWK